MRNRKTYIASLVFLSTLFVVFLGVQAFADNTPFKSTPYPLPRFVSLGTDEIFVRTGPGKQYPIDWVFTKQGLPVEIVLEYEHWRKIRDVEGQEGWVYGPLLSGRRTALVVKGSAEQGALLLKKPKRQSRVVALLERNVIVEVEGCEIDWCEIEVKGFEGWMPKSNLWGLYPKEQF